MKNVSRLLQLFPPPTVSERCTILSANFPTKINHLRRMAAETNRWDRFLEAQSRVFQQNRAKTRVSPRGRKDRWRKGEREEIT